jgi:hypothetical protein
MLYESGLPLSFWGEALAAFVYVHNKIITSALLNSMLHEAFLGNKPDLSMLHVWGCTAYVLVQKDKQPPGSLGSHMEKYVFIGYPAGYKAWKFYCPERKKVIISERADFDEHFFINQQHSTCYGLFRSIALSLLIRTYPQHVYNYLDTIGPLPTAHVFSCSMCKYLRT